MAIKTNQTQAKDKGKPKEAPKPKAAAPPVEVTETETETETETVDAEAADEGAAEEAEEDADSETEDPADPADDADAADEPVVDDATAESNSKLADFAKGQTAREKKAAKVRKDGLTALPSLPRSSKAKPPKPCACGCLNPATGKPNMTRGGLYLPGHDGRPKGWMIRIERGILKLEDVPNGERQVVAKLLAAKKKALSPETKA